ncbi:MAG TPA: phage tail tip lysozyme [Candidatus Saccharimonadales bacterium]|nr:phage tail tip lysozyme [Candidatus Saccharimonadales bacterium]
MHRLRQINRYQRAVLLLLVAVCLIILPSSQALAYTGTDYNSFLGKTPFYDPDAAVAAVCAGGATVTALTGNDNEQQAYNFFIQNGLSPIQASAVVGNLMDESHVDPTEMQIGGDSNNPNDAGSGGWGIAQWTPGGKAIQIAQSLKITSPIYELSTQLAMVWGEMGGTGLTGVQDWVKSLQGMTDLNQATQFVEAELEEGGIANSGVTNPPQDDGYLLNREGDAQSVLSKYGGASGNSGSTTSSSSNCSSSTVNCSSSTATSTTSSVSSSNLSQTRQNIVCNAQKELATWKAEPNYNSPYPDFIYAATGFLKYTDNNYEEWCADFVSWIYNQAGYPFSGGLDGGWRQPSVVSIQVLGQQNQNFHWHPESSGYTPQPGDLALHYDPSQANPWYHINIFVSSSGGESNYIGGDQGGNGTPDYAYGSQHPASGSVVSLDTFSGYYSDNIVGYVSPD